jgi:hypothetical protein
MSVTSITVFHPIRQRMTEADVETIIQRARERYPDVKPRIISEGVTGD